MPLEEVFEPQRLPSGGEGSTCCLVIIGGLKQLPTEGCTKEKRWWQDTAQQLGDLRPQCVLKFVPRNGEKLEPYTSKEPALELLEELQRRFPVGPLPRLVLVGHGFGGYILMNALFISHDHSKYNPFFFNAVVAILFLGTIRNHGDERFEDSLTLSAALQLDERHSTPPKRYRKHLEDIRRICEDFESFKLPCTPWSFCETIPTTYRKHSWMWKFPLPDFVEKLVETSSMIASESLVQVGDGKCVRVKVNHTAASGNPWESSDLEAEFHKQLRVLLAQCRKPILTGTSQNTAKHQNAQPTLAPRAHTYHGSEMRRHSGSRHASSLSLPCHVLGQYQENPAFVGREDVLEKIDAVLNPKLPPRALRKFALVGSGGMGKTQLALKYSFTSRGAFPIILWANAETPAKLSQSYSEFDRELNLSQRIESRQIDSVKRVKQFLSRTDCPWLMVLDNLEVTPATESVMNQYWPSGASGSILVTTRGREALGQFSGDSLDISQLPMDKAIELLLNLSKQPDDDENRARAEKICSRIDCFPLAISSAAWLIQSDELSLQHFLKVHNNTDLILKSRALGGPEAPYTHTLAAILEAQLANLANTEFMQPVGILACLDHSGIRECYFREASKKAPQDRRFEAFQDDRWLRELHKRRLIHPCDFGDLEDPGGTVKVWMHKLIHDYCLMHLRSCGALQEAFTAAFELIRTVWRVPERHNRHNPDLWSSQQNLIRHVEALAVLYSSSQGYGSRQGDTLQAPHAFAELCYNGAWYSYERGEFESADALLKTAKEYCDAHPDGSELIVADIYGAYGSIQSESNSLQDCEVNFGEQLRYLHLAIDKGLETRPSVREALAYGGLANISMGKNKYQEAQHRYEKCLEIWDDCPGDAHIYIPHLAVCLTLQNKADDAETLLRKMIDDREHLYGPKDTKNFRTAIAYFALGNTQIRQEKFDEAYETHRDALGMLGATVGEGHHRYADACYKMGWHLHRRGGYNESINYLHKALKIYETRPIYSNEEARTRFLMSLVYESLAGALESDGNTVEAEKHKKNSVDFRNRAVELRKRIKPESGLRNYTEADFDELIMFWSR